MINTQLLTRPFSCHEPKDPDFQPQIRGEVNRVSRSRRNGWRVQVFVDGLPMSTGHFATKYAAENHCAKMLDIYTKVHYDERSTDDTRPTPRTNRPRRTGQNNHD